MSIEKEGERDGEWMSQGFLLQGHHDGLHLVCAATSMSYLDMGGGEGGMVEQGGRDGSRVVGLILPLSPPLTICPLPLPPSLCYS